MSHSGLRQYMYVTLTASSCPQIELETYYPVNGLSNESYTFEFKAFNGNAPYKYEIEEGKLPIGIELSEDGVVSGLTRKTGIYPFTLSITDSNGCVELINTSIYFVCTVVGDYPYQESFENKASIPDCWQQDFIKGDINWDIQSHNTENIDYPEEASTGNNNAFFQGEDYEGKTTLFITPQLDLTSLDTPQLSFWHIQRRWYNDQDELRIYYKNNAHADWKLLKEFTEDIVDWKQTDIELPEPSSEYFIGFEGKSNFGFGIGLDDISVYSKTSSGTIQNYFNDMKLKYNTLVEDLLTIRWEHKLESVYITNIKGDNIAFIDNLNNNKELNITTTNWVAGIYIVKVRYEYASYIFKVIKK